MRLYKVFQEFWFINDDAENLALIHVESFLSQTSEEKFTSSAGNEITKEKIYNLLKPNTWLCDQIVNISIEAIKSNNSQIQLTDTFFFAELNSVKERLSSLKWAAILNSSKTWVIPVNLDLHWSLILLHNRENGIDIECWDSLPTQARLDKIKSQLISSYNKYSKTAKAFSISYNDECYIQQDHSNCGTFLIANIFAYAYNKKPCNLDLHISRIAIARMIVSVVEPARIPFL